MDGSVREELCTVNRIAGVMVPDDDEYLRLHLGGEEAFQFIVQYDAMLVSLAAALPLRRVAIDVGANVGLWSLKLARLFRTVVAFEPVKETADCFVENVHADNVSLFRDALGDRHGEVCMRKHGGTSLKSHVTPGEGTPLRRLDGYGFTEVDFIKVDCEGFDFHVLEGALGLIEQQRPAVLFESKPGVSAARYRVEENAALNLLLSLGYRLVHAERGNYFCRAD